MGVRQPLAPYRTKSSAACPLTGKIPVQKQAPRQSDGFSWLDGCLEGHVRKFRGFVDPRNTGCPGGVVRENRSPGSGDRGRIRTHEPWRLMVFKTTTINLSVTRSYKTFPNTRWSTRQELNLQPAVYNTAALPVELQVQIKMPQPLTLLGRRSLSDL